jgi:hypothetical protein
MTTHNTPAPSSSRRLVLTLAVAVALLCTAVAYEGMFQFGRDMLGWTLVVALAFAGIFELAQIIVALLAREAVKVARPAGTLLTITWMLAAASGFLAAWHELAAGHGIGAALFRIAAPVLAAGLWHLVLIGDRHLAAGRTWSQVRADARMHALILTVEDAARAHPAGTSTPAPRRTIARAEARRRRARAVALRTVPPDEMRAKAAVHLDALSALADAVSDVAAMHAATNHRVAGLSVSGLSGHVSGAVLSAPDSGERAARTLAADLADNTPDSPADNTPDSVRLSAPASGPVSADKAARLAVVTDLLATHPDATTTDALTALTALTAAGHRVADRTARRLLAEIRTAA